MHELPDEYLSDAMPVAKKIALAQGIENYNILQVGFVAPHVWCLGNVFSPIEQRQDCTPGLPILPDSQDTISLEHVKQVVDHVHFHVIPKPCDEEGLVIGWPTKDMPKEELAKLHEELLGKL